jgi:DNA-binding NarL/FixJ family response regulator
MAQSITAMRWPVKTWEVAAIAGLALVSWFVAELSNGFFADVYFAVSLTLALAVGSCVLLLWRALQQESVLRAQAEERLRAAELTRVNGTATGTRDPAADESNRDGPARLSARELQIVSLIAEGLTNQQIAAELQISINTVERHVSNSYRKLNVRGRVEAAALIRTFRSRQDARSA